MRQRVWITTGTWMQQAFRFKPLAFCSFDFMQLQTRVSKVRARRGRCRSRPGRSTWRSTRLLVSVALGGEELEWGRSWVQGSPRWRARCGSVDGGVGATGRTRTLRNRRESSQSALAQFTNRRSHSGALPTVVEARTILLAPGYDARSCIPVRQGHGQPPSSRTPATPPPPAAASFALLALPRNSCRTHWGRATGTRA